MVAHLPRVPPAGGPGVRRRSLRVHRLEVRRRSAPWRRRRCLAPPGRAGRADPASAARRRSEAALSFSMKSHCSSMPASSTIRRSWTSPHRPRTFGERSALRQRLGGPAELLLGVGEAPQTRGDFAKRALALVDRGDLCLDPLERFTHRLQQRVGVLEEVLAILLQGVAGDRRERVAHLRLGVRAARPLLVEPRAGRPPVRPAAGRRRRRAAAGGAGPRSRQPRWRRRPRVPRGRAGPSCGDCTPRGVTGRVRAGFSGPEGPGLHDPVTCPMESRTFSCRVELRLVASRITASGPGPGGLHGPGRY